MAYLPFRPKYGQSFKMEDELEYPRATVPKAPQPPKARDIGGPPQQEEKTVPTVETPETTTGEQPETRDFGITALIVGLAGAAVSAAGAASSAEASDEALEQQAELEAARTKEEKEERERARRERGLQRLGEWRHNAQQRARTQVANKKFLQAWAKKNIGGGPGVTTLGG